MTIYLDFVLLLSFLFNGAILFVVSYIVKTTIPWRRLLLGTVVATLFVPLTLYFPHSIFNTISAKTFYSILIVLLTFGYKSFQQTVKQLITFYAVSFIAGGSILSIHYLLDYSVETSLKKFLLYVDNIQHDEISLVVILLGFPISLYVAKIWSDRLILDRIQRGQMYKITLEFNDSRFQTTGFLDSGNQLVDPITNRPVIVCDSMFMKQFFSIDDWENVRRAIATDDVERIPFHLRHLFLIIPFKTIAGENHYLFAIKPDKLTIQTETSKIVVQKVLVGIQISPMTNDGSYHCLLHPHLVALQPVEASR